MLPKNTNSRNGGVLCRFYTLLTRRKTFANCPEKTTESGVDYMLSGETLKYIILVFSDKDKIWSF